MKASCHDERLLLPRLWLRGVVVLAFTLIFCVQGCSPVVVNPAPLPISQKSPSEYRIQPGDQIEVKLFYNPELNESVTVRPDGRVSLPLAHEIPAAGLTPSELTQVLKNHYSRELSRVEITILMRSFAGRQIFVDGEVNRPGLVPLSASMTVLQSIAVAGGIKDSARSSEIVIIRRGPESKSQVFTVDLTRVLDGTDIGQDVTLMPFDVVYVPKSAITNVNVWIDQYLRKNVPVSFGLSYQINPTTTP
jgi:protein involved in polysaccharide export with SLBB domain